MRTGEHRAGLPPSSTWGEHCGSAVHRALAQRRPSCARVQAGRCRYSPRSASRPSAIERRVSASTSTTSSGAPPVQLTHSAMGVARSRTNSSTQVVRSRARGISSVPAARRGREGRAYGRSCRYLLCRCWPRPRAGYRRRRGQFGLGGEPTKGYQLRRGCQTSRLPARTGARLVDGGGPTASAGGRCRARGGAPPGAGQAGSDDPSRLEQHPGASAPVPDRAEGRDHAAGGTSRRAAARAAAAGVPRRGGRLPTVRPATIVPPGSASEPLPRMRSRNTCRDRLSSETNG